MTLEQVVDKLEELVLSAPNIETFVFDDLETVNELHATDYPLCLLRPTPDELIVRGEGANEQDYALEFYLMDTYFMDDADSLRKKYSDLQIYGTQLIQEFYDVQEVKGINNVTVDRGQDQYNDNLVVVQFNFTVRVHECMRLLKKPTSLALTVISDTQIDLTWRDNETTETNYEVARSADGNTWETIATIASDSTSYNDTSLVTGTTYYYKVRATSASNRSAYSEVKNETTL